MPVCRGCLLDWPQPQLYLFTWTGVLELYIECTAISVS